LDVVILSKEGIGLKRYLRTSFSFLAGVLLLVWLSGCAYPNELRKENQANPSEFITVVQQAIDQYRTKTSVLPIKNSDMTTPLYEKYVIDFGKLQRVNLLSTIPANAFEKGGIFMYVLVNVETKPEVKLMDLTAYQSVVELQKQVEDYKSKHAGALPIGIQITPGFYYLDMQKLGSKAPTVKSTYNRQSLINYVIQESTGTVAIDYAPDIMKVITSKQLESKLESVPDLRELLVANSYFVPARSFAYRWSDKQPLPYQQ
jgi:hypothetical protein